MLYGQNNVEDIKKNVICRFSNFSDSEKVFRNFFKFQNSSSYGDQDKSHGEKNIPSQEDDSNLDNTNLYISNLSVHTTEESIYKHFIKFGGIESIKIIPPKTDVSYNKNIAFINFLKSEYAKEAKEFMNEKMLSGNQIKTKWGRKLPKKDLSNMIPSHVRNNLLIKIFLDYEFIT